VVVNLAHRDIASEGDRLFQNIDIAELERRYAAGNSKRMKRLQILAQALELAFTMELPVRVVVFDGELADENSTDPTRVTARELDPIPWAVTERSASPGVFKLTRGASPRRFVDQFTIAEPVGDGPSRRTVISQAFERSAVVRQRARQRAGGKCEYCGCPGFTTSSGEVYLETHHIVPLSESGLDIESNVIALCPNHHREAHFGENRGAMRTALLQLATPRARPR
jgi:5-methylcytosine-specific restriction protein A